MSEGALKFSIEAQIAEVEREIRMRLGVYDRMTFPNGTFKRRAEADMALNIMQNVLETLKWARDNRPAVVEWVNEKAAARPRNILIDATADADVEKAT